MATKRYTQKQVDEMLSTQQVVLEAVERNYQEAVAANNEKAKLLGELEHIIKGHEEYQHVHRFDSITEKLKGCLHHYQNQSSQTKNGIKSFRDDLVVQLRALSIMSGSAGHAPTHREKEARFRGLVEELESMIESLRRVTFDEWQGSWHLPDYWTNDYPVRQYKEELLRLQAENAHLVQMLNGESPTKAATQPTADDDRDPFDNE